MLEQSFGALALGNITVHDDQSCYLAVLSRNRAGCGFENSPGTIFVADAVFQTISVTFETSFLSGLQNASPITRMYLLHRGSGGQFFGAVSEYLSVSGAVVKTVAMSVDNGDHIDCILGDEMEEAFALGQFAADTLKLQMLIDSIDVE